jgi:methylase of polypeptide subunit release factors
MIKKDLFGFVTQGLNYELFRPKYPGALLGECLRGLKMKNNYLDVATGTGQVLFKLCGEFKGTLIGTDISENMLKAAQTKAYEF